MSACTSMPSHAYQEADEILLALRRAPSATSWQVISWFGNKKENMPRESKLGALVSTIPACPGPGIPVEVVPLGQL